MGWCWKSVCFYLVCWHPFLSCPCYCSSAVELKRNLYTKLQAPPLIFCSLENRDTRWTQHLLVFNLWAGLHTNTSSISWHDPGLLDFTLTSSNMFFSCVFLRLTESLVDEKRGTNVQMSPACFSRDRSGGVERHQHEVIFNIPAKVFHVLSHTFFVGFWIWPKPGELLTVVAAIGCSPGIISHSF